MRTVDEILLKLEMLVEEITLGRLSRDQVGAEKKLMEDLGLDSLDYATLMLGCEEWLGVKVDEASIDWRKVQTVRELANLLHGSQK